MIISKVIAFLTTTVRTLRQRTNREKMNLKRNDNLKLICNFIIQINQFKCKVYLVSIRNKNQFLYSHMIKRLLYRLKKKIVS